MEVGLAIPQSHELIVDRDLEIAKPDLPITTL